MSGIWRYTHSRVRRLLEQLQQLPRAVAMVWRSARHLTMLWLLLLGLQGVLPIATVYLTRALVNALVQVVRSNGAWTEVKPAFLVALWMTVLMLSNQLLRSATIWVRAAQAERVKDYLADLIQQKSVGVDLAFYDSADFYDHLHRARLEASYRPALLIDTLGTLLQSGITMLALIGVLIPFGPVLPLALLASAVPVVLVTLKAAHRRHAWNQSATAEERRSWYYDALLTNVDSAAEMRVFALGAYFRDAYQRIRHQLRQQRHGLARKEAFAEFWAGLLALTLLGVTLLWSLWRALRGFILFGDLALFYQAFNQGLSVARNLLENVGQLYENTLFLGNLFEFLDLRVAVTSPAQPEPVPRTLTTGIRFDRVSFRYPGSDRMALREFSLEIQPDQIIALVGPNGAGKSTLIKLLCRFYDAESGLVTIDGVPLERFALEDLRRLMSVQFQASVRYNASVMENIRYGDLQHSQDSMLTAVGEASRIAGADEFIDLLPQAYDTHLGRWFVAGSELSIGQWQRLGLARAFFRTAPIIILDEPTSAMDPWAELEWGERFRAAARGRIAILITHRFTTAMFADLIHVVFDGSIVESGSHQQLLTRRGLYAQGWAAQSHS